MKGDKIAALKTAADNLIDGLPNDDSTQVGIVPFSAYVNVGLHNRHASWMDVEDDYSDIQIVGDFRVIAHTLCLSNGSHSNPSGGMGPYSAIRNIHGLN